MQTTRLWRSGVFSTTTMCCALAADVAELGDRRGRVGQQALLVGGVDPGARHHARAVARPDLVLVGVDQRVERGRIDQPLLDQQRFERLHPQGRVRGQFLVVVIVIRDPPCRLQRAQRAAACLLSGNRQPFQPQESGRQRWPEPRWASSGAAAGWAGCWSPRSRRPRVARSPAAARRRAAAMSTRTSASSPASAASASRSARPSKS